jgi:hypothetical protein
MEKEQSTFETQTRTDSWVGIHMCQPVCPFCKIIWLTGWMLGVPRASICMFYLCKDMVHFADLLQRKRK